MILDLFLQDNSLAFIMKGRICKNFIMKGRMCKEEKIITSKDMKKN